MRPPRNTAVNTNAAPRRSSVVDFLDRVATGIASAGIVAVDGIVNATFVSASANVAAVANRSAGILFSALTIAAFTCPGTVSRAAVTGGAFSVMTFATIACAELP